MNNQKTQIKTDDFYCKSFRTEKDNSDIDDSFSSKGNIGKEKEEQKIEKLASIFLEIVSQINSGSLIRKYKSHKNQKTKSDSKQSTQKA